MSDKQLTKFNDGTLDADIRSDFYKRLNLNNVKMELSERKHLDGTIEKTTKFTPMTTGDYIGIWAVAILKSLFLILFVFMAFQIYKDIQAHVDQQRTVALVQMKNCGAEYEQNQCAENFLIESMQQRCQELEICMNQNIESLVRTQQVWLQVLGHSFEVMFKSLSIKSCIMLTFITIAVSIVFIKN